MLDFRTDTFLEVCRCMNFTRAAGNLNLTQPAVSQHIHFLEEWYGAKLFLYQEKRLTLTEAGEMLKNAVLTMKNDTDHLRDEMKKGERRKRNFRLGLTLTIAESEAAKNLASYLERDADCSMKILVDNTENILRELDGGIIDFALVEGNFPKKLYCAKKYRKEKYIAVCGADYPLERRDYSMDELLKERIVTREEGSGTRNILEKYLEAKGMKIQEFHAVIEAGGIHLIKELVKRGNGITFLYETAVSRELLDGSLRKIGIEDFQMVHTYTFIWRRNSIFSEEYGELMEALCGRARGR